MPKDLGDVHEQIISAAKEMLLQNESFSIRALSTKVGIATGTVYNYFPTKEAVIAAVMSEDWQKTLQEMDRTAEEAPDLKEGCREIYRELRSFIQIFESVWIAFGRGSRYESARASFHMRFRSALTERISTLFVRFNCPISPELLAVFGEILITAAIGTDLSRKDYEAFLDLL